MTTRHSLTSVARRLAASVDELRFVTPSHVYNPLLYAWRAHRQYLERFGTGRGRVLLLGMNPGPWGMAQTGVPFGEVNIVRSWFGIQAPLRQPLPVQHPKYPIVGFDCQRTEGSGQRFWGWAAQRFDSPERFFARFFVWNYCPLLFIAQGRNLVPAKLERNELELLCAVCDRAMDELVQILHPVAVVGIGRWPEARARMLSAGRFPVSYLHHPSPANPAANRNWPAMAETALAPWLRNL